MKVYVKGSRGFQLRPQKLGNTALCLVFFIQIEVENEFNYTTIHNEVDENYITLTNYEAERNSCSRRLRFLAIESEEVHLASLIALPPASRHFSPPLVLWGCLWVFELLGVTPRLDPLYFDNRAESSHHLLGMIATDSIVRSSLMTSP
ncbi:Hypothetical protein FKW44_000265, partial [Caligus rogercresseyi]